MQVKCECCKGTGVIECPCTSWRIMVKILWSDSAYGYSSSGSIQKCSRCGQLHYVTKQYDDGSGHDDTDRMISQQEADEIIKDWEVKDGKK